ncbi:MAG: glycosyltransferase WbuB, partial [Gammaproteobacteria bacterium RIFOXYB2_FULL_38_6]
GSNAGLSGEFIHGKREGWVDGIRVIQFSLPYSNYLGKFKRGLAFIRFALKSIFVALKEDYDLLFATSTPLTAGIPGIFAKIFRKKPFIFEVRDLWPELPKAMGAVKNKFILKGMDWLESLSYYYADACVGLSPGIVQGILKKQPQKKVMMIPNGCDLDLFNLKVKPDRSLLPDTIFENDFVAVFTGAHGVANGLDAVLDAANVLKIKQRVDIKLLFVGDGKLKPALMKRAIDENLDQCVFINPIQKTKMPALLKTVNLGLMILANVSAFYYGTSPNKFFDYLASGLPVLNNYPGWLAQMIKEHHCGIAVKPDDPTAFAESLIYCADHPNELIQMGKNARKLAETNFSREKLANEFISFLETV